MGESSKETSVSSFSGRYSENVMDDKITISTMVIDTSFFFFFFYSRHQSVVLRQRFGVFPRRYVNLLRTHYCRINKIKSLH